LTKLKYHDLIVYEWNSSYQIRCALAEKRITEDNCDTGSKIYGEIKRNLMWVFIELSM
jgi:hypothetical protein